MSDTTLTTNSDQLQLGKFYDYKNQIALTRGMRLKIAIIKFLVANKKSIYWITRYMQIISDLGGDEKAEKYFAPEGTPMWGFDDAATDALYKEMLADKHMIYVSLDSDDPDVTNGNTKKEYERRVRVSFRNRKSINTISLGCGAESMSNNDKICALYIAWMEEKLGFND